MFSAEMIESEIRQILVKCLVNQSEENKTPLKDVQIRFLPFVNAEDLECKYQLLIDYKPVKDLSFIDIASIWKMPFKAMIEAYIIQLFMVINEREGIEIPNIRLLIQATANNPTEKDLIAYLYDKSKLVRELKVSEFVGQEEEEETEQTQEQENETNY